MMQGYEISSNSLLMADKLGMSHEEFYAMVCEMRDSGFKPDEWWKENVEQVEVTLAPVGVSLPFKCAMAYYNFTAEGAFAVTDYRMRKVMGDKNAETAVNFFEMLFNQKPEAQHD